MDKAPFQDQTFVNLDSVMLVSGDGAKVLDIKNYVISISIAEDIFSPFITCEVNVVDFNQIAFNFPLVGEEFLVVNFWVDQEKPSSFTFNLYKNGGGGVSENNKFEVYTLYGITPEKLIDGTIRVSQSFRGSYSEIAQRIFEENFSKFGKELTVEPSKGSHLYVSPNITPLTVIDLCRKRALSVKEPFTPYLFFQNQKGYYFTSIHNLFKDSTNRNRGNREHVYGLNLKEDGFRTSHLSSYKVDGNRYNDVGAFGVVDKYNTLDKLTRNVFRATSKSFDLTTKAFIQKEYKLDSKGNNYFLGNNNGLPNSESFIRRFDGKGNAGPFIVTDVAREYDGSSTDFYPEYAASLNSYKELITQERLNISIYGDNTIMAGDAFNFTSFLPDGKVDPFVSGNYLVSSLKHVITIDSQTNYILALECLRGDFAKKKEKNG